MWHFLRNLYKGTFLTKIKLSYKTIAHHFIQRAVAFNKKLQKILIINCCHQFLYEYDLFSAENSC
jgi:hypothetical protein